MKFFKNNGAARSTEDTAAADRLRGIVGRGQAEVHFQQTSGASYAHDGVRRRLWTPDELAAESSDG